MKSQKVLKKEAESDRLSHAYLAPVQAGSDLDYYGAKLAQIILCPLEDRKCRKKVLNHKHPDFYQISALNGNSKISINQVKKIIKTSSYSPQEASKKLYTINRAEDLSLEGSNSLLKILEDPPGYVHFLLLTQNIHSLLPTIISRCRQLSKGGISRPELQEILQTEGFGKPQAEYLIKTINGRSNLVDDLLKEKIESPLEKKRDVFSKVENYNLIELSKELLDTKDFIEKDVISEQFLRKLGDSGKFEILTASEKLEKLPTTELEMFFEKALQIYRNQYRKQAKSPPETIDSPDLSKAKLTEATIRLLGTNANVKLLLESVFLQLAGFSSN